MANFTDRGPRGFRFDTAPEGTIARLQVYYSKGGHNMFTFKEEPRGIYVSLSPMKVEVKDNNIRIESFTVLSGTKFFALELKRASPKKLAAVASALDADAPAIASLFLTDRDAALAMLRDKVQQVSA